MLGMLVEVEDRVGEREHLGLLDASQEAHSLLGVDVLMAKVVEALCTQQCWEHPAGAKDQCV